MIELAPRHKFGLAIAAPVMPAAGAIGYGDSYRDLIDYSLLGAIVTNPVSYSARTAAQGQRLAVFGEHFIVHTGHPNPGLRSVIRQYHDTWERLPVPVVVHLLVSSPEEAARSAERLSGVPGVRGLELGLVENVSVARARAIAAVAGSAGDLPVLVRIPFSRVDELAPALAAASADALTLIAPPRAVWPLGYETGGAARYMRGRLYGPSVFALMLNALAQWASKLPVPVVACGGIATPDQALACLSLGAAAVQIDALLWRNPSLLVEVAKALMQPAQKVSSISQPADEPSQTVEDSSVDDELFEL